MWCIYTQNVRFPYAIPAGSLSPPQETAASLAGLPHSAAALCPSPAAAGTGRPGRGAAPAWAGGPPQPSLQRQQHGLALDVQGELSKARLL